MDYLVLDSNIDQIQVEHETQRSRFITLLSRANSLDAARSHHEKAKQAFPDARHHCFAYIISEDHDHLPKQHSNDDGEPSGTAGRPMLDVLSGFTLDGLHLVNVSCVVVRYFGGTILGTGGIVRAYSKAVTLGIAEARYCQRKLNQVIRFDVAYEELPKVEFYIHKNPLIEERVQILEQTYKSTTCNLCLATTNPGKLLSALSTLISRQISYDELPPAFVEVPLLH